MAVEISKRLLFVNSLSGVLLKVLNVTVLVWLQQYLLKRISTEEYSILPVVYSIMVVFPFLTTLFTSGISRYIVEAYAKEDRAKITRITSSMFVLLLIASAPILAFGLTLAYHIEHVLNIDPRFVSDAHAMMALLVSSFVLSALTAPFQSGLYVRQKFVLLNGVNFCVEVLRISILFVLLFFFGSRVLWIVVATVSASTVGTFVLMSISRRLIPEIRFRRDRFHWSTAKEVVSFGGWSLLGQVGAMVQKNADAVILNKLATAADVTCYYLGAMPGTQLLTFFSYIKAPLVPQLTGLWASDRKRDFRYAYLRGNRIGLWVALFPVSAILVLSEELVRVWVGEEFAAAATVAVLLLSVFPITYANFLLGPASIAMAQIRETSTRSIIVQILNLGMTLFFVGVLKMGAIGSALGTFIATAVFYPLLTYRLALRLVGVSASDWVRETILPGWIPGIVAVGMGFLLKRLYKPQSLLEVFVGVAIICLIYLAIAVLCMKEKDRRDAREVMDKFRGRLFKSKSVPKRRRD